MSNRVKSILFAGIGPWLALVCSGCGQGPFSGGANVDDSAARLVVKVDTITPNEGPAAGGTRVTIIGGPYEDQIGVLFGKYAAVDPIVVNSRMITAFAPAQDPGVVDVTVITDAGKVTVLGAFRYTTPPQDVVAVVTDPTQLDIVAVLSVRTFCAFMREFSPLSLAKAHIQAWLH